MLGVFSLPAFTRRGHECRHLLSPCDGYACVHRLDPGLHSHPKVGGRGGGGELTLTPLTHINSKGKIPSTGIIVLRGESNPRRCIKQNSEPNTLPGYSRVLTFRVLVVMGEVVALAGPHGLGADKLAHGGSVDSDHLVLPVLVHLKTDIALMMSRIWMTMREGFVC